MRLNSTTIGIIQKLLLAKKSKSLGVILKKLKTEDLATLYSLLAEREARWFFEALVSHQMAVPFLLEINQDWAAQLLKELKNDEIFNILVHQDLQDIRGILEILNAQGGDEEARVRVILSHFNRTERLRLEQLLNYLENTAGRLMSTEIFSIDQNLSAQEALFRIRLYAQDHSVYYIYLVDEKEILSGVVSLRALVTCPPDTRLSQLTQSELVSVLPDCPLTEVAKILKSQEFIALPVVNSDGRFLGIITIDEVLEHLQEEEGVKALKQVGLTEDERVFTPAPQSVKNRAPWMLLNLGLAALGSMVVNLFEATISELVILASLNNIVSGLGGNTGGQTLAVILRGLALGDFDFTDKKQTLFKELLVGLLMGLLMGAVTGLLVYFWKAQTLPAIAIGLAMMINSIFASLVGVAIPLAFHKFGKDPALGSGVIITTTTDIFGFFSFLGIASILLKLLN